jgi:hypothetical protein
VLIAGEAMSEGLLIEIGRAYLPLFTAIDQFCFHSYMICHDSRYVDNEEAVKRDRIMEEYVESLKLLQLAIRRFFESGIPLVINEFDSEAYQVVKGALPFYLNLPHEHYVAENVGRGYGYLQRLGAWMSKRVPAHVVAQNYEKVLTKGFQRALGKDEADVERIAQEFEKEHLRSKRKD